MTAAFLTIAVAFVISSTWQIARGVLGLSTPAVANAPPPAPECVAGITRLEKALDRGLEGAAASAEVPDALRRFEAGAEPEWSDRAAVENACNGSLQGKDAFTALVRLRNADETFLRRQVAEVEPIRRDVEAYLR